MRDNIVGWNHGLSKEQLVRCSHAMLGVIEAEHLHTHEGRAWSAIKRLVTIGDTIAECWLLRPQGQTHLRDVAVCATNGPTEIFLFEGTVVSSVGTAVDVQPLNRVNSSAPTMLVTNSATVTTTGTLLDYRLIPGVKQDGGIGEGPKVEWVLNSAMQYLVVFRNAAGQSAAIFNPSIFWYEPSSLA